jgi:hypothetical protein
MSARAAELNENAAVDIKPAASNVRNLIIG